MRGLTLDHLGSEAFTWYDLATFVKHVQLEPHSALAKELHGEVWTIEAQLLASIADTLASANWQRAGKKSAPRPKPIPRPWEKAKATAFGKDAIPISQFNDWWESAAPKKPPTA